MYFCYLIVILLLLSNCGKSDDIQDENILNYNYINHQLTSNSGPIDEIIQVRNGVAINITNPNQNAETINDLYENFERIANKYLDPNFKPNRREHYKLIVYCNVNLNITLRYVFITYSSPNGSDIIYRDYINFEVVDSEQQLYFIIEKEIPM